MNSAAMNVQEAATYVGVTPGYLNNMRHNKKGPHFTKKGHRVVYAAADLDAWNETRKEKRTERANAAEQKAQRLAAHAAELRSGKQASRRRAKTEASIPA